MPRSPSKRERCSVVQARIAVHGGDADRESLWDWLRHEPELRGRLALSTAPTPDEAMGGTTDLVVQCSAALAGAGAVWAALAKSLSVWLVQRRSDLTITVTGPDRTVSVSAQRVADPEQLLRSVLEATPSGDAPDPGTDG